MKRAFTSVVVRLLTAVVVLGVLAGGSWLGWWYWRAAAAHLPSLHTEPVTRGDLVSEISATGTVEPWDVVDVGAQVAGQIVEFGKDVADKPIDYSSAVRGPVKDSDGSVKTPGTLLAQIDPRIYKAKVEQSEANLNSMQRKVEQSQANLDRSKADLQQMIAKSVQAGRDWDRAKRQGTAIAPADYDAFKAAQDTANANVEVGKAAISQAEASLKDAQAAVKVAEATLKQDRLNLEYCDIRVPDKVEGEAVVIDRRVTIGQTVQSSFNTPSLFLLAKDLKRMKVWAAVNEADIGRVHEGQEVRFTVDTFPGEEFIGTVGLMRLNATMTQNVVTYTVEVNTENPPTEEFKHWLDRLLVEKASDREDAVKELLRYSPDDVLTLLPDPNKQELASPQKATLTGLIDKLHELQAAKTPGKPVPRKLKPYMTANLHFKIAQRENVLLVSNSALRWRPQPQQVLPEAREATTTTTKKGGTRNPGRTTDKWGRVWVEDQGYVKPIRVRLGLTDGNNTEVREGDIKEGMELVTGEAHQGNTDTATNPFAPSWSSGQKKKE
jgi:HlyD family secretion protein